MNWKILRDTLFVDGVEIKKFSYPVRVTKEIQGTVVIVLDIPPNVIFSDNAYGFVLQKRHLWQIEPHGYYPQEPANDICIIGISPTVVSGQVIFFTWVGILVYVDLFTGVVVKTEIGK